MVVLKITSILVSDDLSLARWNIMICDLEVLTVSLLAESQTVNSASSAFNVFVIYTRFEPLEPPPPPPTINTPLLAILEYDLANCREGQEYSKFIKYLF